MHRFALFAGASVMFSSVFAVDAIFDAQDKVQQSTFGELDWTVQEYWTDSDHAALDHVPITSADNVTLTNYWLYADTQIYLGTDSVDRQTSGTPALPDWSIGTLIGDAGYSLTFPKSHAYWVDNTKARKLTVGNPDGFLGHWRSLSGRQEIVLQPTSSYSPKLSHVDIDKRMIVTVPSNAASVDSLDKQGTLEKRGAGDLKVVGTEGTDTKIHVVEGSVTLAGRKANCLVSGAALHLDASDAGSLVTETGPDDLLHVTRWNSADGENGVYATISTGYAVADQQKHLYAEDIDTPVLSGRTSSSGLTMLDFSATNCAMSLSQPVTGIRQVFYVAARLKAGTYAVLGSSHANEYDYMGNSAGNSLFSREYGAARFGYIEINGKPVSNRVFPTDSYSPTKFDTMLVSVETPTETTVRDIASERYYNYSTGGYIIGEILAYTRTLTSEERKQVTEYLMSKWFAGYAATKSVDADNVVLVAADTAVGVPSGAKARVNGISSMASTATITKTGEGELTVGAIGPKSATLDIQAGSVKFAGAPEGADDSVSAVETKDPYVWLRADAGYDSNTSYIDGDGRLCVTNWADCRGMYGHEVYARIPCADDGASAMNNFSGKPPYVLAAADNPYDSNGNAVMRFTYQDGSQAAENQSWMMLVPHGIQYAPAGKAYDGFIVYRQTNDDSNNSPFGSCDQDLYRSHRNYLFLSPGPGAGGCTYAAPSYFAYAARWTLDGLPVDPTGPFIAARHGAASGYHVAAVSSDQKLPLDYLAKDRPGSGARGQLEIGEFILFDHKLSPLERRNVEAYLLKKWLNREHPDTCPTVAKTVFPGSVPAVVDTDAAHTDVGELAGGNGTFVKRGTGTLATGVQNLSRGGLDTIKVEKGSLTLKPQFDLDSAFHVDASDGDSVTLDAEGKVATWSDVYDRCKATTKVNGTSTQAKPQLKTVQINAVDKQVVDFGEFSRYKATDSSGMRTSSAGMTFDQHWRKLVTEAHIVARVTGTGALGENAPFFSHQSDNDFLRGSSDGANDNYQLFNKTYASAAYYGTILVDGSPVADGSQRIGTGSFITLTSVPTNAVSIDTICMDRGYGGGGLEIAEIIAFTNASTAARARYVHDYLRHKWFGAPAPVMTNAYERIEVAAGATLNAAGLVLEAGTISCAGTINAAAVAGLSSLDIAFAANGSTSPATVLTCPAVFDEHVTVNVTCENRGAVQSGLYALVTASSIDADLSGWTVNAPQSLANRMFTFVRSDDGRTISLKVATKGLTFIVQ